MDHSNPFTISFGMEPSQYIERIVQLEEIEGAFTAEVPSNRIFITDSVNIR